MHEGHRGRMRERIEKNGLENLNDHEVLEYLLFFINKRKNTNGIGHNLMETFGRIDKVFDASEEALCSVDGIGPVSAQFLSLIPELCKRYVLSRQEKGLCFVSRERLVEYLRPHFYGFSTEIFVVMFLDANLILKGTTVYTQGTPNEINVNMQRILNSALTFRAAKVVISHNHPNNVCRPSKNDKDMTNILRQRLNSIDVQLIDHLIICANDNYYSFNEDGLI
ncbi:MAG: DNA repair protein RadC [Bacillota bacterium]|nr:DNA repair protein RadC [Bacillota bacterium]